jgi:Flp pilus assembly protein TadG
MLGNGDGLKRSITRKFRDYCNNTSGNIATFFALSVPFVLIAVGSALDSARITREYTSFHSAVDSAAVALATDTRASTLNGPVSQANLTALTEVAKKYIATNYSPDVNFSGEVTVDLSVTATNIIVNANLEFPTTLMKLVGVDSVSMSTTSQVELASRPIELVMVLDSTTSLGSSGLSDVKTAAKDLLTKLYGSTTANYSTYIRVGLVPFAAVTKSDLTTAIDNEWFDPRLVPGATMADKKTYLAGSTNGNAHWNGCMGARARHTTNDNLDYLTNDAPPATDDTKFPPLYLYSNVVTTTTTKLDKKGKPVTTTSTTDNRYASCASIAKIVPLTYNRASVVSGIDSMVLTSNTNISEGAAWGMRVISNSSPYTTVSETGVGDPNDISTYNHVKWKKFIVLMSDGDNTQPSKTTDMTAPSLTEAQMDADTLKVCSRMKSNGVTIYTAGFKIDSQLLKDCATQPSEKYYKYAATTSDLTAFFNNIGQTVNKMIYVSK